MNLKKKKKEKTILVIDPGSQTRHDSVFHLLVMETGEHLASHWCSHAGFAPGDLCYDRPERMKEWKNRFGDFEVKFIDEVNITREELVKRNKRWYEKYKKEKAK